jgi:hypothetical protein
VPHTRARADDGAAHHAAVYFDVAAAWAEEVNGARCQNAGNEGLRTGSRNQRILQKRGGKAG